MYGTPYRNHFDVRRRRADQKDVMEYRNRTRARVPKNVTRFLDGCTVARSGFVVAVLAALFA